MKTLYKLHFSCWRMWNIYGLFIADDKDMNDLISSEKEVYFGEVLGKHSEICWPISDEDITIITKNEDVITMVEDYDLEIGYNPFDYIEDDE